MKKYIIPILAVILILVLAHAILPAPEPERCAICDSIPMHAPALVNLATGEVGELEVYDPHPFKVAELDEFQQGGMFRFIYAAGLNGYSDTANWETHITMPINENEYEETFFCKYCRNMISNHTENGYLLLDLREPKNFSIISLSSDEVQTIRCYEISIVQLEGKLEIVVHGNLKIVDQHIVSE